MTISGKSTAPVSRETSSVIPSSSNSQGDNGRSNAIAKRLQSCDFYKGTWVHSGSEGQRRSIHSSKILKKIPSPNPNGPSPEYQQLLFPERHLLLFPAHQTLKVTTVEAMR
ncbi:Uncharacterized protein Adt_01223 [Abeliophyllum distichum]|uniref:Uncharacterized protein n=1 Tax=Abeliophyllum distichum TaxID=126358 RepID=A0ABD1VVC7_9LAMI